MQTTGRLAAARRHCTFPYNYCDVKMSEAYPTPAQRRVPTDPQAAGGQKLPNGSRIVAQDNGQATSLVSIFVDAGAKYETADNQGVADFVNRMLFKSNLQSSDFAVAKTFQHAAANNWTSQVNNTLLSAKVECRRDAVGETVKKLVEGAFIPRFAEHEMYKVRDELDNSVDTAKLDGKQYTLDLLNANAFNGASIASTGYAPKYNINKLSHEDLIEWWSTYFIPERVIIGGVNVTQDELADAYNKSEWSSANTKDHPSHKDASAPAIEGLADNYRGGSQHEFHKKSAKVLEQYYDDVYIAYGRKGAGHASVKSLATELVAAGSLGAHLREGFGSEGVVRSYDKDSVVGGIVRVRPENADAAVKQLVEGVDSVGKLSGSALESAKKAAAISFLNSVNTREGLVDFLALHSEASGIGKTVPAVLEAIAQVSAQDLSVLGATMQSARPTYVAFGDLKNVPSVNAI